MGKIGFREKGSHMRKLSAQFLFGPVLVVSFVVLAMSCDALAESAAATITETPVGLEQKWGIKPVSLRLTASDHFLDFRYRVLDSGKARNIMRPGDKPVIIDQSSGKVLPVPNTKIGALRAIDSNPKEKKNYAILFRNMNKVVKKGSKVSIVIGDFKLEDVEVR